ncbi:MAG: hypothetical protein WB807_02080, partial [Candidatus Dormiibacterota bacterium]
AAPTPPGSAAAQAPTPLTTSTPGAASEQATLTGDPRITGPLNADGVTHFVTCDEPSLSGAEIFAFENAADPSVGVFLTIRRGFINVRLASGSGAAYTERDFAGSGVTSFGAASGAQFSSSLTEATPAGTHKGTVEAITSIAGSVSCGTFTPGGGTVTVTGDTGSGTLSGSLTSIRVECGGSGQGSYAIVAGLSRVGSTPALINVDGGNGASPLFVTVSTGSGAQQFSNSATGLVTFSAGVATYHATLTQTAAPGAGGHTVMVNGSATCGS